MKAGQMRQLVDIQNPVTETDNTGQDTYSFSTIATKVPADVKNISQRKTEDGYIQASGQETFEVWMRYNSKVGYNTRLLYRGLVLSVTQVMDQRELNHAMKLRCEVVDL
jgi:SPP1 family predicted phage head-tail adaptor